MSLDAKIDLERIAKACRTKDHDSAAIAVGNAVLEAADNACKFFRGSLELDCTEFVLELVDTVDDAKKQHRKTHKGGIDEKA